jgi:hypothetical protein
MPSFFVRGAVAVVKARIAASSIGADFELGWLPNFES